MSELLAVKIIEKTEDSITFKMRIVHPDQTHFPYSLSFAAMLLDEVEDNELAQPLEQTEEEEANDLFFDCVEKVELKDVRFLENTEAGNDNDYIDLLHANKEDQDLFWSNSNKMPEATLVVSVNYVRAVAHLAVGMQWTTAAFEELEDSTDPYWTNLHQPPFIHERS